ncbi:MULTISPECIES: ATP-binding protein [Gordonibacter]|uniref:ATP-binding protein n=2 Tax=Gordonibacter TaxID=644652 RepID=A0ABT7DM88_9ACTN|nr:ATP-binding protein [Gordonibacter sp. KGMB12511]MDJ1650649.1 ATP-binding protein [Gordonibacter sp. KGMB12511]HIW75817.1 ATP-binding protein [Candidatus Gordonibacter avicola]
MSATKQPLQNPFKPTAGKMPPELIGRDQVIEEFRDGLANGPGAPERLMRVSGVRGMGKTVMLSEFKRIALVEPKKWTVVSETASPGFSARILEALSRTSHASSMKIQPTAFGVSLGSLEIERASLDLREAMIKATEKNQGLLITLDEVQDASLEETKALAIAVQHIISEDRNIAFVFAGLPSMISEVVNGNTLTFLRRAIPVNLEAIPISEVAFSLADTMRRLGRMTIKDDLVDELAHASAGYPFMVQLVGYQTWQVAFRRLGREAGEVSAADVEKGISEALARFDAMVIEPAVHHVSPSAMRYLLAMAEDQGKASETSEVAARLGMSLNGASPVRAKLIKDGIIEAADRGKVSFTIPYMARYLEHNRQELEQEVY